MYPLPTFPQRLHPARSPADPGLQRRCVLLTQTRAWFGLLGLELSPPCPRSRPWGVCTSVTFHHGCRVASIAVRTQTPCMTP